MAFRSWQQPTESNHWSWSFYNYMRSCRRTQCWPFYGREAFEANWKGENAISECLMSWPKILKNRCFEELSSLILCNNNKPFLCWIVTRNEEWILYDNQQWSGQCVDQKAPKHFPKPKKGSESLFGGLLLVCSTTASWIPVKSLHLRSMLSKSMRCTENCNTRSWYWSTERA